MSAGDHFNQLKNQIKVIVKLKLVIMEQRNIYIIMTVILFGISSWHVSAYGGSGCDGWGK